MTKRQTLGVALQRYGWIGLKSLIASAIAWIPAVIIGGMFGISTALLIRVMGGGSWESAMLIPMAVFFAVITIVNGFVLHKMWGWS